MAVDLEKKERDGALHPNECRKAVNCLHYLEHSVSDGDAAQLARHRLVLNGGHVDAELEGEAVAAAGRGRRRGAQVEHGLVVGAAFAAMNE